MLKGTKVRLKHNSGKKGTVNKRVKVRSGQSSSLVTTQTGLSCRCGAACPWQGGMLAHRDVPWMLPGMGKGTSTCLGEAGCSRKNIKCDFFFFF